ncbi:MAG: potassium-transporting ATPase subunit B, partial [Planctomyces sp.]
MLTRPSKQMFNFTMLTTAVIEAIRKLDPRVQVRRPVMMTVYVGSLMTTVLAVQSALRDTGESSLFVGSIAAWLWFTVLFANFAEAMAEGRGKA